MKSIFILIALLATLVAYLPVQAGHIVLQPEKHSAFLLQTDGPTNAFSIWFDLSEIPAEALIDLAELRVTVNSDTTLGKRTSVTISPALSDWNNSDLPSASEISVSDSISIGVPMKSGEGQFLELNVNRIVKLWHSGEISNHGFYIQLNAESDDDFTLSKSGPNFEARLVIYYSM